MSAPPAWCWTGETSAGDFQINLTFYTFSLPWVSPSPGPGPATSQRPLAAKMDSLLASQYLAAVSAALFRGEILVRPKQDNCYVIRKDLKKGLTQS